MVKKLISVLLVVSLLLTMPMAFAKKPESIPKPHDEDPPDEIGDEDPIEVEDEDVETETEEPDDDIDEEDIAETEEEVEDETEPEEPEDEWKGPPAAAINGLEKGNGQTKHLYLYSKDPVSWAVIDGAWAKMNFKQDRFVFNAHELTAGESYSLIYYPDPWPGTGLQVLGQGIADEEGNLHLKYDFSFTDLPIEGDDNAPEIKIWLVLSSDLVAPIDSTPGQMSGWNPTSYLFEYNVFDPITLWSRDKS